MKRHLETVVILLAAASLLIAGCTQAAPASPTTTKPPAAEPTKASAAPTKPAEPSKAATAQPTAAKALDWPQKGKSITIIVPWAAGSPNDVFARMLAPYLEKELGTPVVVEAKPGAGSQVGMTELARAKPDGYTLGVNSLETTIAIYLDPDRQAVFSRKSFTPISLALLEPDSLITKGDGPYKTTKDLIDAAKANPEKIKMGTNGLMTATHMGVLVIEKAAGVKFAAVHFNGSSENATALLGGHTDAGVVIASGIVGQIQSGQIRLLGILGTERWSTFPDVKTLREQGLDAVFVRSLGIDAPVGTPPEIVAKLDGIIQKTLASPEFVKKADEANMLLKYMNSKDYAAHWDQSEAKMKVMIDELKAQAAKSGS